MSINMYNKKCKICNNDLGLIYITTKTKKVKECYYFSKKPKVIDGIEYYRTICQDCFFEKFKRDPKPPNRINKDFNFLMGVPFEKIKNFNKKLAVTLKNLQERYGLEEGKRRFEEYKEKQALSNTYEYKKEKYQWSKKQFEEYNKSRSVTLENLQERYGKIEGRKKFEDYCKKQKTNGNTLEYFINKFGIKEGTLKYEEVCKNKAITLENMIKIHGETKGLEVYMKWLNANRLNTKYYSTISQELFFEIYKQLDKKLRDKTYFATLNEEFNRWDWNKKRIYFFDFVISNIKYCIEFNGEHVHPNKEKLTEDQWKNWKDVYTGKSSEERYEEDQYKTNLLKNGGYDVRIIWFEDYVNNKQKIIGDIINEINEKMENN